MDPIVCLEIVKGIYLATRLSLCLPELHGNWRNSVWGGAGKRWRSRTEPRAGCGQGFTWRAYEVTILEGEKVCEVFMSTTLAEHGCSCEYILQVYTLNYYCDHGDNLNT